MGTRASKQPLIIDVTNPHIPDIDDPKARIKETAEKLPKATPIIRKIDAELTDDDIKCIVDLYNTGSHVRSISNALNIELETVRSVVRKKTGCTTMINPSYTDKFRRKYDQRNRPHYTADDHTPTERGERSRTQNEEKFLANSREREKTAEKDLIDNFLSYTQDDKLPIDEDLIGKLIGKSQILTRTEIINILADHGHINAEDYLDPVVIKRPEPKIGFEEFKKTLKVGDVFRIRSSRGDRRIRVTIQKIYPHVVTTDKGTYQIAELYIGKKIDPDDQTPDPQEDERPFSFSLEED